MRIGFDSDSLNINIAGCSNKTIQMIKHISDELLQRGHDIYFFCPTDRNRENTYKYKSYFSNKLRKAKISHFNITFPSADNTVEAFKRNYIDIAITGSNLYSERISEFTDCIFYHGTDIDSLIKRIDELVRKNRKAISQTDVTGIPSSDKLWLNYYREGDYKWIGENMSPYDRLVNSNKDWPDEIAMEFYGNKITYGEFIKRVNDTSDILYSEGICKGMLVPLIVANTPESIIVLYALFRIKATVVPIYPLSTSEDLDKKLKSILKHNKNAGLGNTVCFMSNIVYGRFARIIPEEIKVIVLNVCDSMPRIKAFAFKHIVEKKMGISPVAYSDKVQSFSQYTKNKVEHIQPDTSFDNTYTAVQLYTGGTVKPKAVRLSEGNIDCASKQFFNDRFSFRRGDKIAAFMPLNHSFGLIIGTHVAASLGVQLDIIAKIDFKRLDKLFIKDRINLFGGIPTMFPAIRNNTHLYGEDLSHVKYILSGGSLIDNEEKARTTAFFKEHGSSAELHDGYGLTESSGGIIYDGIPNMNVDVKIIEGDSERELGYEEIGQLCMSGPQIMIGYDDNELSQSVLKPDKTGKIWLHTGDNAVIHQDGRVEIIGRMDRMIKVNGEQVILDDIEELINTLPFIEKSAVVKRTDPKRGYVPVAFIQIRRNYQYGDKEKKELDHIYKYKLTAYSEPRETIVVDSIPLTGVGKVDFKKLEELAELKRLENV